jgi:S1-C subfamily serine protease
LRGALLKILKLMFGRRKDGVCAIQRMASVPLEAEDKRDADFYPVREDIFVVRPDYIGTIRSMMGQSIVPVVAIIAGEDRVRCLGTGFFVSCTGLLVTAAHVITDPIERSYGGVREIDKQNWFIGDLNRAAPLSNLMGNYPFSPVLPRIS